MDSRRRWQDDPGLAAWSAFLRAHAAAVAKIDRDVQLEARLPLSWYDVLLELNAAPGRRMRMLDLGEAVVLSRTRVSRVVDELVRAGFVRKEPNPDDGRSSFAVLTDEGRSALRRAAPIYLTAIRRWFIDALPASDLPVLRDALESVVAHAQRPVTPAPRRG